MEDTFRKVVPHPTEPGWRLVVVRDDDAEDPKKWDPQQYETDPGFRAHVLAARKVWEAGDVYVLTWERLVPVEAMVLSTAGTPPGRVVAEPYALGRWEVAETTGGVYFDGGQDLRGTDWINEAANFWVGWEKQEKSA